MEHSEPQVIEDPQGATPQIDHVEVAAGVVDELLVEEISIDGMCGVY